MKRKVTSKKETPTIPQIKMSEMMGLKKSQTAVILRVPQEFKDILVKYAAEERTNISNIMRMAFVLYLESRKVIKVDRDI